MGLDVQIYAEGDFTAAEFVAADEYLRHRTYLPDREYNSGRALVAEENRVSVYTLHRYYGEGYERGNWPLIYGVIRLMQTAFPRCKVFYGSDSTDFGMECTEEFLDEVWQHFLGPNGDDYRRR